jgi:hypothetical protein
MSAFLFGKQGKTGEKWGRYFPSDGLYYLQVKWRKKNDR